MSPGGNYKGVAFSKQLNIVIWPCKIRNLESNIDAEENIMIL